MYLRSFSLVAALLVAGLFLIGNPSIGWAQQVPQLNAALTSPQIKEYGRTGYAKNTIYVWGTADTGVWSVEKGINFLEFVSVISRVRFEDRGPERRSIQTIRLYRENQTHGKPFFESRVEKLFTQRSDYPVLQDGDILVFETTEKSRFSWRTVREVVSTAAIFLNTYLLVSRLND